MVASDDKLDILRKKLEDITPVTDSQKAEIELRLICIDLSEEINALKRKVSHLEEMRLVDKRNRRR